MLVLLRTTKTILNHRKFPIFKIGDFPIFWEIPQIWVLPNYWLESFIQVCYNILFVLFLASKIFWFLSIWYKYLLDCLIALTISVLNLSNFFILCIICFNSRWSLFSSITTAEVSLVLSSWVDTLPKDVLSMVICVSSRKRLGYKVSPKNITYSIC